MMKRGRNTSLLLLLAGVGLVRAQFGSLPWASPSNIGPPSSRPGSHHGQGGPGGGPGKHPPRPYNGPPPRGGPPGSGNDGPPPPPSRGDPYSDLVDPIPPLADSSDGSYDTQQLPAKLPILAPNGVVEIYNRVVDDLIRKLEGDLVKKELDPMAVVIRPTPPGPVRVPGYLQKRPFRRPGAALYRSTNPERIHPGHYAPTSGGGGSKQQKYKKSRESRSGLLPPSTRFESSRPTSDGGVVRGAGKISKTPLSLDSISVDQDDEKEILEPETAGSSSAPSTTSTTAPTTSTTEGSKDASVPLPAIPISSEERAPSSEEDTFMKPRSDEFFPEPEEPDQEEEEEKEAAHKKKSDLKKDESEESEQGEEATGGGDDKDVDSLIQHYQSKNSKTKEKGYGGKVSKGTKNNKPVVVDPSEGDSAEDKVTGGGGDEEKVEKERKSVAKKNKKKTTNKKKEKESDNSEEEDDDEEDDEGGHVRDDASGDDDDFGPGPHHRHPEAGTGGGKRPSGGYYPPNGPPAIPAKPNAQLSGLGRIRRASDVSVSVDARSAVITARLLVGPIHVLINDSIEPMEKNVKATIPELEAELLLMERHGVVFLQRFTLDRAYGQDVEISIPKSKESKKKASKLREAGGSTADPNHPINVEARRQTKMAAHISMEVVKLLRSGNLRVNLMRTAQGAMSKLKLPIKKAKKKAKGKSSKKDKKRSD